MLTMRHPQFQVGYSACRVQDTVAIKDERGTTMILQQNMLSTLFRSGLLLVAFCISPISAAGEGDIHSGTHLAQDRFIKATKPWKIGVVSSGGLKGNQYWPVFNDAMRRAGEEFGVQVAFRFFNVREIKKAEVSGVHIKGPAELIDEFIAEAVDGLIVFPFGGPTVAIERVHAKGIPVITINSRVPTQKLLTQLTFNNYDAGLRLGRWVAGQLKKRSKVTVLTGTPQQFHVGAERTRGIVDGLGETGTAQILDIQDGIWDRAKAMHITNQWLKEHRKLDAILAINDAMALGAVEAIEAAGAPLPIIVGVDAVPDAREAVRQGRLAATVDQAPAKQGRMAVQLLLRHLETGESYPKSSTWKDSPILTVADLK
jgi:ribose transport system substrate-binding protein